MNMEIIRGPIEHIKYDMEQNRTGIKVNGNWHNRAGQITDLEPTEMVELKVDNFINPQTGRPPYNDVVSYTKIKEGTEISEETQEKETPNKTFSQSKPTATTAKPVAKAIDKDTLIVRQNALAHATKIVCTLVEQGVINKTGNLYEQLTNYAEWCENWVRR